MPKEKKRRSHKRVHHILFDEDEETEINYFSSDGPKTPKIDVPSSSDSSDLEYGTQNRAPTYGQLKRKSSSGGKTNDKSRTSAHKKLSTKPVVKKKDLNTTSNRQLDFTRYNNSENTQPSTSSHNHYSLNRKTSVGNQSKPHSVRSDNNNSKCDEVISLISSSDSEFETDTVSSPVEKHAGRASFFEQSQRKRLNVRGRRESIADERKTNSPVVYSEEPTDSDDTITSAATPKRSAKKRARVTPGRAPISTTFSDSNESRSSSSVREKRWASLVKATRKPLEPKSRLQESMGALAANPDRSLPITTFLDHESDTDDWSPQIHRGSKSPDTPQRGGGENLQLDDLPNIVIDETDDEETQDPNLAIPETTDDETRESSTTLEEEKEEEEDPRGKNKTDTEKNSRAVAESPSSYPGWKPKESYLFINEESSSDEGEWLVKPTQVAKPEVVKKNYFVQKNKPISQVRSAVRKRFGPGLFYNPTSSTEPASVSNSSGTRKAGDDDDSRRNHLKSSLLHEREESDESDEFVPSTGIFSRVRKNFHGSNIGSPKKKLKMDRSEVISAASNVEVEKPPVGLDHEPMPSTSSAAAPESVRHAGPLRIVADPFSFSDDDDDLTTSMVKISHDEELPKLISVREKKVFPRAKDKDTVIGISSNYKELLGKRKRSPSPSLSDESDKDDFISVRQNAGDGAAVVAPVTKETVLDPVDDVVIKKEKEDPQELAANFSFTQDDAIYVIDSDDDDERVFGAFTQKVIDIPDDEPGDSDNDERASDSEGDTLDPWEPNDVTILGEEVTVKKEPDEVNQSVYLTQKALQECMNAWSDDDYLFDTNPPNVLVEDTEAMDNTDQNGLENWHLLHYNDINDDEFIKHVTTIEDSQKELETVGEEGSVGMEARKVAEAALEKVGHLVHEGLFSDAESQTNAKATVVNTMEEKVEYVPINVDDDVDKVGHLVHEGLFSDAKSQNNAKATVVNAMEEKVEYVPINVDDDVDTDETMEYDVQSTGAAEEDDTVIKITDVKGNVVETSLQGMHRDEKSNEADDDDLSALDPEMLTQLFDESMSMEGDSDGKEDGSFVVEGGHGESSLRVDTCQPAPDMPPSTVDLSGVVKLSSGNQNTSVNSPKFLFQGDGRCLDDTKGSELDRNENEKSGSYERPIIISPIDKKTSEKESKNQRAGKESTLGDKPEAIDLTLTSPTPLRSSKLSLSSRKGKAKKENDGIFNIDFVQTSDVVGDFHMAKYSDKQNSDESSVTKPPSTKVPEEGKPNKDSSPIKPKDVLKGLKKHFSLEASSLIARNLVQELGDRSSVPIEGAGTISKEIIKDPEKKEQAQHTLEKSSRTSSTSRSRSRTPSEKSSAISKDSKRDKSRSDKDSNRKSSPSKSHIETSKSTSKSSASTSSKSKHHSSSHSSHRSSKHRSSSSNRESSKQSSRHEHSKSRPSSSSRSHSSSKHESKHQSTSKSSTSHSRTSSKHRSDSSSRKTSPHSSRSSKSPNDSKHVHKSSSTSKPTSSITSSSKQNNNAKNITSDSTSVQQSSEFYSSSASVSNTSTKTEADKNKGSGKGGRENYFPRSAAVPVPKSKSTESVKNIVDKLKAASLETSADQVKNKVVGKGRVEGEPQESEWLSSVNKPQEESCSKAAGLKNAAAKFQERLMKKQIDKLRVSAKVRSKRKGRASRNEDMGLTSMTQSIATAKVDMYERVRKAKEERELAKEKEKEKANAAKAKEKEEARLKAAKIAESKAKQEEEKARMDEAVREAEERARKATSTESKATSRTAPGTSTLVSDTINDLRASLSQRAAPASEARIVPNTNIQKQTPQPATSDHLPDYIRDDPLDMLDEVPDMPTSDVGKSFNTDDLLFVILQWIPQWFEEMDKQGEGSELPPVLKKAVPWLLPTDTLWPVPDVFDTTKEYIEIMLGHILHETWASVYSDYKRSNNKRRTSLIPVQRLQGDRARFHSFIFQGLVQNYGRAPLMEGDMVIVHLKVAKNNQSSGIVQPVFGYVEETKKYRPRNGNEIHQKLGSIDNIYRNKQMAFTAKIRMHYKLICPDMEFTDIEIVSSLTSVTRQMTALMSFQKNLLCRHLIQPNTPRVFNLAEKPLNKELLTFHNPSQAKAVQLVTDALLQPYPMSKVCLIQGPPGTGKSHTILSIIRETIFKKTLDGRNPCLLLCAPSNAAIDELVRRLALENDIRDQKGADRIRLVRIGAMDSMNETSKQYSLDAKVEEAWGNKKLKMMCANMPMSVKREMVDLHNRLPQLQKQLVAAQKRNSNDEIKKLEEEIKKLEIKRSKFDKTSQKEPSAREKAQLRMEVLAHAHVVCSTLNSAGSKLLIEAFQLSQSQLPNPNTKSTRLQFTGVLIDEACQSVEVEALIPLQYGSNKLVLIGDPHQLPPTVISQHAETMKFSQSLFERLFNHFRTKDRNCVCMLDTQYRMHPEVVTFPSQLVYDGRLKTDRMVAQKRSLFPFRHYLLFDLLYGREQTDFRTQSVGNHDEVDFILTMVKFLITTKNIKPQVIGIITPYRRQLIMLKNQLKNCQLEEVCVGTVDGFQGQEKDVIIVSCVRAHTSNKKIGFVADRRRLNVALTRAKYSCYVVGHMETLRVDENWCKLVNDARRRKCVIPVRASEKDNIINKAIVKTSNPQPQLQNRKT